MTRLFLFFTWLGDWERTLLLTLFFVTLFVFLRWRKEAIILATAVLSSKAIEVMLKDFFQRDRPDISLWLSDASGFAFPSGHATVATALYGTLALILFRRLHRGPRRVIFLLVTLVTPVLIGSSRVYLGVHWPSDVLGGWVAGAIVVLILAPFIPKHDRLI